jgi:hypothetical protein
MLIDADIRIASGQRTYARDRGKSSETIRLSTSPAGLLVSLPENPNLL